MHPNGEWSGATDVLLTHTECSTKADLSTVVCPLIGLPSSCALYTPWGTRVTSCSDIKPQDSIFAVQPNRLFILPVRPAAAAITHMSLQQPMTMRSISAAPRVLMIDNVLTAAEADGLVAYFHEELPYYYDAWDAVEAQGEAALALKKRLFDVLGIFPFDDSLAEPMQIVRLNTSSGVPLQHDYIATPLDPADLSPDLSPELELDPDHSYTESNRFVTVIVALADGADLLLPQLRRPDRELEVWRNGNLVPLLEDEQELLRAAHIDDDEGWEAELLRRCYLKDDTATSSEVRPVVPLKALSAMVIYSQGPEAADPLAVHGICPVLGTSSSTPFLARMHIWNLPRHFTSPATRASSLSVSATFEARDVYAGKLYWEDTLWEELAPGRPIKVNTFAGHRWHVRLDMDSSEPPLVTWVVAAGPSSQRFVLTARDLPIYNF